MPKDIEHYRAMLDSLQDGVYFVDQNRQITFWNKGAEALSGYSAAETVGRYCFDSILKHVDEDGTALCGDHCPLLSTIQDGKPRRAQVYLHHKEGHRQPVTVHASPLFDEDGNIVGATEVFRDDEELVAVRRRMAELEALALTDPLTGVGNRRHFDDVLQTWLAEWHRYQHRFGLLLVDVDEFKQVNDTWGHDCGDLALRMVATSLRYGLRASDVVARFGGDEFCCLVRADTPEELAHVGERVRSLVRTSTTRGPNDCTARVTVSIGGALTEPEDSAEILTQRADTQLYQAKRWGRDRVVIDRSPECLAAADRTEAAPPETATTEALREPVTPGI